jgi:GT2 family glycosyltransferase
MSVNQSVTVIVLNWNGRELLEDCLGSLEKVDYNNFNVLVVDNGSTDKSVNYIKTTFPSVDVLELGENLGYAAGNNAGFKHAVLAYNMEYVIFLNNDTIVEENFIEPLLVPFRNNNVGQTIPKIFYAGEKNKIWYAGGRS